MSFLEKLETVFFRWKYNLAKPGTLHFYEDLNRQQHLSPDEIETLSWKKTKKLLTYAYQHVPFYRKRFELQKITPEDICSPHDFEAFPLLTRQDLMESFNELLSDEFTAKDVQISTTGGSNGTPAKVCHQRSIPRAAMGWRLLDWWGISPAANSAEIYRITATSLKSRLIQFLQSFPGRKIQLNATSFTDGDMTRFLQDFCRVRPELVHGYVGAADSLANYMLDNKISVPPPKAIWLTSAPITPVQQNHIETAFGAPVYDQYGCCEIYWLSAECKARSGLHMFYDCRRFEFVDSDGKNVPNGEYGDIVITDLENYAFPLIRYANGDRGRRLNKSCTCGCNLPLMDKVKGRVSETFVLPSGTRINGEFLTTLFDDNPDAVKQFQVHQKKDASIILSVIPNQNKQNVDDILDKVKYRLNEMVHYEVPVSVEIVSTIPQKGGKLRFVVSEMN